jgi:putative transposase
MAILTYKIRVDRFFKRKGKRVWYEQRRKINKYLRVGRRIAKYSIKHRSEKLTSKDVKHLGKIPGVVSNQIIRKYKNNKKCRKISNVNLIVPGGSTRTYPHVVHNKGVLNIKPLKMNLKWSCPVKYQKINQVELNNKYCYVCVTVDEKEKRKYKNKVGVDLNIRHNLATVGNPDTKRVEFLGKGYIYQRAKYIAIRKRLQRQGRLPRVKQMGDKEYRVMRDLNQKITTEILNFAKEQKAFVAIEDLTGIRKAKCSRSFGKFLNAWPFYQFRLNLQYKCDLQGLELIPVDPRYTSQDCSNCDARNKPKGKLYKCKDCGLKIHRDENASYNIAKKAVTTSELSI